MIPRPLDVIVTFDFHAKKVFPEKYVNYVILNQFHFQYSHHQNC